MSNDFKDLQTETENEYTDRTLRYKLIKRREGVAIEIDGTDPLEGALLLAELDLYTKDMPGYYIKEDKATKGKYSKQEQYKLIRQRYAMRKRFTANK